MKRKTAKKIIALAAASLTALALSLPAFANEQPETAVSEAEAAEETESAEEEAEDIILSFETTDIDGNPVTSEEVFGAHAVTMLNIWTSWCGYCIDEMPELEALHEKLADQDCAVVGLLYDGNEPRALETAKGILEENGVTYTNLLPPANVEELFLLYGFPTSFFVDRNGRVIGSAIIGAMTDQYEPAMMELLQELPEDEGGSTVPSDDGAWHVVVLDEAGAPVEGATIQLCSDEACYMQVTDAAGTATFENEEGAYTVHVLSVPEGYGADDTEYTMPETWSTLTVTLGAA